MKKPDREDLFFLLIGLLLLTGMLLTFLLGGNRSRHGVGMRLWANTADRVAVYEKAAIGPGQRFSLREAV